MNAATHKTTKNIFYIPGNKPTHSNSFKIKDGCFADVTGISCKLISPYEVKIDDWNCLIKKKGLVCTYVQPVPNGNAVLRYTVFRSGLTILSLKAPGKKFVSLYKRWITKPKTFDFNCIITLSNGGICQRFVKFKKIKS